MKEKGLSRREFFKTSGQLPAAAASSSIGQSAVLKGVFGSALFWKMLFGGTVTLTITAAMLAGCGEGDRTFLDYLKENGYVNYNWWYEGNTTDGAPLSGNVISTWGPNEVDTLISVNGRSIPVGVDEYPYEEGDTVTLQYL